MRIENKIDKYLVENNVKNILMSYIKRVGKNAKKVRQEILDNFVNSSYSNASNQQVEKMWKEYNKIFPS